MGKKPGWTQNRLVQDIAVGLLYLALYLLVRPLSHGIWIVTAGLRLSALLLVPYRQWPALVLGDTIGLLYYDLPCMVQFGPIWVTADAISPFLLAAPVVWWFRAKEGLFPSHRIVKVKPLLSCVGVVTCIWTAGSLITVRFLPPPLSHFTATFALYTTLGKLVGILTFVPLALCYKLRDASVPWVVQIKGVFTSRVAVDALVVVLPTLLALFLLSRHGQQESKDVIRIFMFVPVGWLTLRHGWRAASFGTAVVMTALFINMSHIPNAELIQTQAFICFATVSLLVLGARTTSENLQEQRERLEAKEALRLAQQGLYLCEVRMRQTSYNLEQIAGTLQVTHNGILKRFRHMISLTESQNFFRQASATNAQIYQLADSLHPLSWRERGLPSALRESIGRTLDEQGFVYHCSLEGRGLSMLSPGVHSAIYRFACEAAVYVCENFACSHVYLTLRGGFSHGQRWVVIRLEGKQMPSEINDPVFKAGTTSQLATKLGTQGLGLDSMRSYAHLFDGGMHVKATSGSLRITALLHDINNAKTAQQNDSAALAMYLR
jgi:glucose-6-phosphate-specific signal transduction histidine kinase